MYPRFLFINPDPEAHSGHFRLQLFVSSKETTAGIPEITGLLIIELISQEDPDKTEFAVLTIVPAICYSEITGNIEKISPAG
jgi:hypothetical protein